MGRVALVVGSLVSVCEAYLVLTDQAYMSPKPLTYWGLFINVLAPGMIILLARGHPPGDWTMFLGFLVRLAGYAFLIFGPCTQTSNYVASECPYPYDAHHNLVFHLLISVSLVLICEGARQKVYSQAASYLDLANADAQLKASRGCCSGGW